MRKRFKLKCYTWNDMHVTFNLFDNKDVNCGMITVLTSDVKFFLMDWDGDVDWNGKLPLKMAPEIITRP